MTEERTNRGDASGNRRGGEPLRTHRGDPRLELLGSHEGDILLAEERVQRGEIAAIRVDGSGRPLGLEGEQVALDVGVGSTHGARPVSPDGSQLLLRRGPRGLVRSVAVASALVGGLVALTGAASATAVADSIVAYPSSQSISASGALPRGGTAYVSANAAIGESEDAIVVVRGAKRLAAEVATSPGGGLAVRLFFAHFVAVEGGSVPDALEPWDGSERASERPNQPIHVEVDVPYGTKPVAIRPGLR